MSEYGFYTKDEDKVVLNISSNHGSDKEFQLKHAKSMKRPILIQIESELFDKYQFKNYALTTSEAKLAIKELTRMVDYLESSD